MNKGFKLVFCKKCNRKRYCTRVPIPGHNFRWTCSKGHSWIIKGVTIERVISIMQDILNKETLESLFNRDNTFYQSLKR